jgi:hypothetical protein
MQATNSRDRWTQVLRGLAVVLAIALIALWFTFAREMFRVSQGQPAPAAIMMPIFFCTLAMGAGLAALRGEGISVALAGGLSIFPMGLFLLLYPGPTRYVGMMDIALIAIGLAIMRRENRARAESAQDVEELVR